MLPDVDRSAVLIEEVSGSEIMPRFRRLAAGDVREKAPGDLVTIADEAVEARLAPQLTSLVPGSIVVGGGGRRPIRTCSIASCDDRPVWIIDPVDGTSNFAEGRPAFAVMVASPGAPR